MRRRLVRRTDADESEGKGRIVDVPRLLDWLGIKYRKHGNELWSTCPSPLHQETRSSWSIYNEPGSEGHGSHHCFGCHFSGGPIELITERLGFSRGFTYQWISEHGLWLAGAVELKCEVVTKPLGERKLRVPKGLISGALDGWSKGPREYVEGRGITPEQVVRWDMHYAVDGDLAGRVVFPIVSPAGEWLSYHSRTFVGHEKRYKNASTEDGYDPGAVFGCRHWPHPTQRKSETLVVCEGAINALSCERADAKHVGALGGSEPHLRQLLQLSTWGEVVVASDGDKAGDALAAGILASLKSHCRVRRAPIPKGCDANELNEDELREVLWQQ